MTIRFGPSLRRRPKEAIRARLDVVVEVVEGVYVEKGREGGYVGEAREAEESPLRSKERSETSALFLLA